MFGRIEIIPSSSQLRPQIIRLVTGPRTAASYPKPNTDAAQTFQHRCLKRKCGKLVTDTAAQASLAVTGPVALTIPRSAPIDRDGNNHTNIKTSVYRSTSVRIDRGGMFGWKCRGRRSNDSRLCCRRSHLGARAILEPSVLDPKFS
jgi:hypothetical protein